MVNEVKKRKRTNSNMSTILTIPVGGMYQEWSCLMDLVEEDTAKPFEPEFAGKLNYYVNAVDKLLKTDDENPTIGLLVCSDMDKIDVQWSFKGISTPMGVATYNNIRIKDALPSQEQLAERVRLLQKELKETKRLMNRAGDTRNSQSGEIGF